MQHSFIKTVIGCAVAVAVSGCASQMGRPDGSINPVCALVGGAAGGGIAAAISLAAGPVGAGVFGGAMLGSFLCNQGNHGATQTVATTTTAKPVAATPMAPAVVPEMDSDGDGVIDRLDRCPNTPAGTKVNANGCPDILMTLTGVNFKFDSSHIEPSAAEILNRAVAALNEANGVQVRIDGHTDSTGSEAYNLLLSQRRADAVQAYLAQHGIAAARLSTSGQGEGHPVDSNDTEAGRFQNRRVELHVLGDAP